MNGKYCITIAYILVSSFFSSLKAQDRTPVNNGGVDGVVRDSARNFVLQSATVAVYRVKDSSLVHYQLSDIYGEFHFRNLPVGVSLKIVASFTGYHPVSRVFTIREDQRLLQLKDLNLITSAEKLQEVVVTAIPPVRMKGDTLEFNADAFKLDSNAVVEDLVRKLPGFTVWGDGAITVYGRRVSSVLVEGKPFFGGDARIALQNLPKGVVDKVQVYQKNKNQSNPLDSVTELNIKLKKDKKTGFFGKLATGGGTSQRYELDANINYYTPRTQVAVVGDGNNTNKVAGDINTLMRTSTFKGVGASLEYQPDFTTQGENRPGAGGIMFQEDFIPDPGWLKNNRLSGNYFISSNNTLVNSNSQTITSLPGSQYLVQSNRFSSQTFTRKQDLTTRYDKQNGNNTFYLALALGDNYRQISSTRLGSSLDSINHQSSNNNALYNTADQTKSISFQTGISRWKPYEGYSHALKTYELQYALNASGYTLDQTSTTAFTSTTDPTQHTFFDRTYNNHTSDINHHLFFKAGDLTHLVFGYPRASGLNIYLENNLDISRHDENNKVRDMDMAVKEYFSNNYLSNNSRYTVLNDVPALRFNKQYVQQLSNRYNKTLSIDVAARGQFYNLTNTSAHSFQHISYQYQRWVPTADIRYVNNQYGDFQHDYSIGYASSVNYPMPGQLVPLVDSSNVYYIQAGNTYLRPDYKQEVALQFKHAGFSRRNVLNVDLNVKAGTVKNSFADSSFTDGLGRSVHIPVNVSGYRYINPSFTLNKAIKYKRNEIQIGVNTSFNFSNNPSYVNGILMNSHQLTNSSALDLHYTVGDFLAVQARQGAFFYHSRQQQSGVVNVFDNATYTTTFSASLNCTKKLFLSSNINYSHSAATGAQPYNFTIWNASTTYRFLRSNAAELKFSALDLLHQNTGIQNSGSNNTLTRGTVNVLQQYFMLTVACYPRKFGLKKKAVN
jgi:hypothetical protein